VGVAASPPTINHRFSEVTFEEPIGDRIAVDDYLASHSTANAGFLLRNNTVRNSRARPVRVGARDGLVEGNTFDGHERPSVFVEMFTRREWAPKRWSENVAIRDNEITRAGLYNLTTGHPGQLWVSVKLGPEKGLEGRPHRNLTFSGNSIDRCAHRAAQVDGAEDVTIDDNDFAECNVMDSPSDRYGIGLRNTRDVTVSETRVAGSAERLDAFGVRESTETLTTGGNTFVLDGAEETAAFVRRDDA
jgi:hypothetical protein